MRCKPLSHSSLPWQQQRRFPPPAGEVRQGKRSVVRLRDVAGDRQPQARAAAVAVARGLEPVERLEHPFQLLRGNAGTAVAIRVRDSGPGIPAQELERVFEPFYRLESSRNRDSGGTGLGLSIARDIAQAHDGSLTLSNLPGGGLEAALLLPRER